MHTAPILHRVKGGFAVIRGCPWLTAVNAGMTLRTLSTRRMTCLDTAPAPVNTVPSKGAGAHRTRPPSGQTWVCGYSRLPAVNRGEYWNNVANVEHTSNDVARTSSRRRGRATRAGESGEAIPPRRRARAREGGMIVPSSSSTGALCKSWSANQPRKLKKGRATYLPAGWWAHHHPGCSPHSNDNDVVVVVRRSSLSSSSRRQVSSSPVRAAVIETARPVGHCR